MAARAINLYEDGCDFIDAKITPEFDADSTSILLALLKREGPVIPIKDGTFGGVAVPDNFLLPRGDGEMFLLLGHGEVKQALVDNATFSSELAMKDTFQKTKGRVMTTLDDPEHRRYKRMVMPAFTHKMVNEQLGHVVRPIIEGCLDAIAHKGEAELIAEFTDRFPYLVIAKLVGVPESIKEELSQAVFNTFIMGRNPDLALQSFQKMEDLYQVIIDDHRKNPVDDLTTQLLETETDGEFLSDEEVRLFISMLMSAGMDTTTRQTATLIKLLLDHPEQFELLRRQPELLEQAIWESLRVCGTSGAAPRVATRDTELNGTRIPAGASILASLRTPNYDEQIWHNPEVFDITRSKQPLMSFSAGTHVCLGRNLSQAEMKIAMEGVLERLPNLRKDEARWTASNVRIRGFFKRAPNQLPVCWDV